jgi:hypothetical protein
MASDKPPQMPGVSKEVLSYTKKDEKGVSLCRKNGGYFKFKSLEPNSIASFKLGD